MSRIITVFDLGPGDGGKGGIVHKLAKHHQAATIIKVGGAQGSHGVVTRRQKFAFSQWGCGTFEGVKTHITPSLIISPTGLLNEADALGYHGIINPFDMLTVDERVICSTPYHRIASRLKELCRTNPRGTIGSGVGEAFRAAQQHPHLIIRAADLKSNLRPKMAEIRDQQMSLFDELRFPTDEADVELVREELALLNDPEFFEYVVERFTEVGKLVNVVDPDYMRREVFNDTAIVESSHGVLTDSEVGFAPHTSAIRTLPVFTNDMLRNEGFTGEITTIGVHRAYTIRHGAGPMPTTDDAMINDLLPGSHKEENRYQGKIRVGALDFVLLRYAVDVCGCAVDGIALSWFDQIAKNGVWNICDEYQQYDSRYFYSAHRIKKFEGDPAERSGYQHRLTTALFASKPTVTSLCVPNSVEEQYRMCDEQFHEKLGIPVRLVSFGPTEADKLMKEST